MSELRGSMAPKNSTEGKVRGDLLNKLERARSLERSEVSGVFSIATQLEKTDDEDGPPISYQKRVGLNDVTIIGVTDGLGGSGSRKNITESGEKSGAHIGAKAVSEAVRLTARSLNTIDQNEIKSRLTNQILVQMNDIDAKPISSMLRGSILSKFPTTLSCAFIVEKPNGDKKILVYWVGDSPVIVQTENQLYTTIEPGSGDAPTQKIHKGGEVTLNSAEFEVAAGSAVRVITSTDALVKTNPDELTSAVDFLDRAKIGMTTDADTTERNLKAAHQKTGDDFTIAIAGNTEPINKSFRSQMLNARPIKNGERYI